jgi:hypothetical protein
MSNQFFDHPILNSPYKYPDRHWELDDTGRPTQKIVSKRHRADFITPIPKSKKQKSAQQSLDMDDAISSEFDKLARIPVLKARMNADLHMADNLKNSGKGNLFVIFGEPDIDIIPVKGENGEDDMVQVKVNGVDVFKPQTGEVISDNAEGIACWFIDTDYNEESFFVRHAYFLGANDPYKSLKTTLKAEINQ